MRTRIQKHVLAVAMLVVGAVAVPAFAADQDGDGLEDWDEQYVWGTDYQMDDTDLDTISDFDELFDTGTIPVVDDSDGDLTLDAVDALPLYNSANGTGGNTPTFSGWATAPVGARSGQSPYDGVNVCLINGVFEMSFSIGGARSPGAIQPFLTFRYRSDNVPSGYTANWSSAADTWIQELFPSGDVEILGFDGSVEHWTKSGSDYDAPDGIFDTLVKVSGHFERTTPGGVKVTYGSLDKIEDRYGNALDFTYTSGRPTSFTDSRGEVHTLTYYTSGHLQKVTMADGGEWEFFYNSQDQLWKVRGPHTTSFSTGITREFRYTNGAATSSLNGNLIAASDGNGNWWLRNVYDTSDRVVKQYVGGGSHYDFDWSQTVSSQTTTVTDRAGNERVWTFDGTKLTKTSLVEKTNRNVRSGEGDYTTAWTHDADGYLSTVTYPRGNGVKYTLNAVKRPTEIRRKTDMAAADGSSDLVEEYAYDSAKFYGVTSHTDAGGHQTTYTLDSHGRPTTVTFPEVTNVTPHVTVTNTTTYNSDGSVATFTDGEGKVTAFTYYTTGPRTGMLHTKVVDDGGLELTTTWDYEDWGSVKSITNPRGHTTTYTVERYGNVEAIASPTALGYVTEQDFDGNLNVVEKRVKNIDWDGTPLSSPTWWTTTYEYTVMDNLQSVEEDVTSSTTRTTSYLYDANDMINHVARDGRITQTIYDERGLVYQRNRPAGGSPVEEWTYDGNRNTTAFENARAKVTTCEYDLFDRGIKSVNALGHYQTFTYDEDSQVTEAKAYEEAGATDVLLAHYKATYDELGRRWKDEDALLGGSTTWYARTRVFDKRSLVTTATDRRSYATAFAYDGAGRRTSVTDAIGNVTAFDLDENGNATRVEETEKIPGSGSTETYATEFDYDEIDRVVASREIDRNNSANVKETLFGRGALGLRKTVDPNGNEVFFTLDGLGRTTQKSEDMGSSAAVVTQWEFNEFDQVTVLRDDNNHETAYTYDDLGRLTQKTYENTKTVSYSYDLNGNVTEIEDQNGSLVAQGFDDLDRLIGRDVTPGSAAVIGDTTQDFAYDALNRLTEATDDDSTVQLTYDSLSRVLTEVQGSNPLGTTGKTVTFSGDPEGNRTKIDYPSGFDANETRDALGRVSAIEDGSSATIASFDLYGAGLRRKKLTFQNGTYTATTYDGYRRPTDIAHKTSGHSQFAGFGYGWDANDNPLFEERSHQSGKGDVYSYDKANRLTKVLRDCDDPSDEVATPNSEAYVNKLEYNMDDVFNLTSYVTTPYGGSPTTLSYTTDAMNQYTAIGGASPTYTDGGSLEDDGTFTYKYDAFEHLCEVKQGSTVIATYTYDALGLGRRTGKVVGSDTTRFVYAGAQSIEEYDGTGAGANLMRLFVFGEQIDHVVMMEAPDCGDVDSDSNTTEVLRFNYHAQVIGSVTHVTGPTGAVVEQYLYDPYGEATIKDGGGSTISGSAIGNPYLYTGRQLDEETGLYYYRARHYSSSLRRFIQRDPAGYRSGPNALAYCGARATRFSDPRGLEEWSPYENSHQTVPGASGVRNGERTEEWDEVWEEGVRHVGEAFVYDKERVNSQFVRLHWMQITYEKFRIVTVHHTKVTYDESDAGRDRRQADTLRAADLLKTATDLMKAASAKRVQAIADYLADRMSKAAYEKLMQKVAGEAIATLPSGSAAKKTVEFGNAISDAIGADAKARKMVTDALAQTGGAAAEARRLQHEGDVAHMQGSALLKGVEDKTVVNETKGPRMYGAWQLRLSAVTWSELVWSPEGGGTPDDAPVVESTDPQQGPIESRPLEGSGFDVPRGGSKTWR